MASPEDARRTSILGFWRTVEMFSPQKVDEVDRQKQVFRVEPNHPLPWQPDHELARWDLDTEKQAWQHVIYLGIYDLEQVFEVLADVFEPDEDSYDERPSGQSALAAFAVDEFGRLVLDSEVLSSCAWATAEVLRERLGAGWVAGFQAASMDFSEALKDAAADVITNPDGTVQPQYIPRTLNEHDLNDLLELAQGCAGSGQILSAGEIRVASRRVSRRRAYEAADHDFLNSFVMADLARIVGHAASGDISAALRQYLRPESDIPQDQRIDVRHKSDCVLTATAPDAVPGGRWPSHPDHALALNQQLAVSTALGQTTAVLGVNGPPGTGKTTMLRDLVAALVTQRAHYLATLDRPKDAFTGCRDMKTGQYKRAVSLWRTALTGFEIVVASSNNGAVENVTDEIPATDAIDESWRDHASEVDYFAEIATGVLAALADTPETETAAPRPDPQGWALIAARLGNKKNRNRFANSFWWHEPDDEDDDPWLGMRQIITEWENTTSDQDWSEAKAMFRAAEARVEKLRGARASTYHAIERHTQLGHAIERHTQLGHALGKLNAAVSAAQEQVFAARQRQDQARHVETERTAEAEQIARARQAEQENEISRQRDDAERLIQEHQAVVNRLIKGRKTNAERAVESRDRELSRRWDAQAAHQRSTPTWWQRGFPKGRRWARENEWLEGEVRAARSELTAAQTSLDAVQREIDIAMQDGDNARRQRDEAVHSLAVGVPLPHVTYEPLISAQREVALAEQKVSDALKAQKDAEAALHDAQQRRDVLNDRLDLDAEQLGSHYPDETWWTNRERREFAALWTDPEWNTARSELFLAALTLHKAFLRHAAKEMRHNLQAAMDILQGKAPADVASDVALAAWQSLFFVVPVVSTTFASYDRVFRHLGKESLGWLLIDEAGQATPQNAVGALWRTKRAIVVGDPLQLEPITTLPFRAEQAIRKEYGVDEQWLTSRTSVQRIADRLTPLGTQLPGEEGPTWVGVPLTVHRRCDQPMFDIVNAIAYDGLMINGTGAAARAQFNATYPPAKLPDSKWIDVTSTSAQGHWIPEEGHELDRILRALAHLSFDMTQVLVIGPFRDIARQISRRKRKYPGITAGTVHTSQGKQGDVVIVVLGSDPSRTGARQWAASKPNLLNVAVSRAKRRLYIIGSHDHWSKQPYFKTLAAKLPPTPPV